MQVDCPKVSSYDQGRHIWYCTVIHAGTRRPPMTTIIIRQEPILIGSLLLTSVILALRMLRQADHKFKATE